MKLTADDIKFIEKLADQIAGRYLRHRPTIRRELAITIAEAIRVCIESKARP